jgi:hypothetical protein
MTVMALPKALQGGEQETALGFYNPAFILNQAEAFSRQETRIS